MQANRHYRPLSGLLCAGAALVAASCASPPPAEAPAIERLTGAALEARLPAPAATVRLEDIVAMTKAGAGAAAIIARLDATHSHHRLGAGEIAAMSRQGVDPKVLDHLIETDRRRIFDDMAAEISQREGACQERIDLAVRQCQLLAAPPFWPGHPFATCWPPQAAFPYWRCF